MYTSRSYRIPLFFLLFIFTLSIQAQDRWSDPSTWPSGVLPQVNENVTIPLGKDILLDIDSPSLGNLIIEGSLIFEDKDIELTAASILVEGLLQVGTEVRPFQNTAIITLTGKENDDQFMGSRFLSTVSGGSLELHGESRDKLSWGQLNGSLAVGATRLTLDKTPLGWQVGDKIVIAPSGYDPFEAEEVTIASVNSNTVSFAPALGYEHFGELQTYEGKTLDERAEVAMLTRNIIVQGAADSNVKRLGGHIMVMRESGPVHIEGVEFTKMGQPGKEARYNFHWHLAGDREGDYLKNSSIHHSLQRAVVVHQTDNVLIENVVAFNIQNHAFVPAEDGNEVNNTFRNNLAMLIRKPDKGFFAFPLTGVQGESAQAEGRVAGFWMRNPHNNLIGNHVAGAERGMGFFFDSFIRNREFKDFDLLPREIVFDGNVAHSCSVPGELYLESVTNKSLYANVGHGHGFFMNKFDNDGLMWTFKNFTSYKNMMGGAWSDTQNSTLENFMIADNSAGLLTADAYVRNTVVIGRSENSVGGNNRHLRQGHRRAGYYSIAQGGDKLPKLTNITFIDINKGIPKDDVAAAMIGHGTHLGINFFENITFKGDTEALYMSDEGSLGRFANSSFLLDGDGSLTGYDRPVLIANRTSVFKDEAIDYNDDWRAYIFEATHGFFLKIDEVGVEIPKEVGLVRDFDQFKIPSKRIAKDRYFNFIGQQSYTVSGNWEVDKDKGNSLSITSMLKTEGEWTVFKYPLPYEGVEISDRSGNVLNAATSLTSVYEQDNTSYYFEPKEGALYLKMVTDNTGKAFLNIIPKGLRTEITMTPGDDNTDDAITGQNDLNADAPLAINALTVSPNPLTSESVFDYALSEDGFIAISILDILGRQVKPLFFGEQESGEHRLPLNNLNLERGIYLLNIRFARTGDSNYIKIVAE